MSTYFSLLTAVGASAMAAGVAAGTPVLLTQVALGDGNGSVPTPTINTTALVNEVHRANINSITQDATNPAWFIVELIIPPATGGFYIREFRIDDANGDAIYVGNCAPEFKPVLADGMTRDSVYRLIVETSNAATINLFVDPNIVTATHDYVNQAINVLDYKQSVRLATTANTALSGLLTIDGVALVPGNRILVKDNTTGSQNGIYTAAVGSWVRSTDADTSAKVTAGMMVIVEEGTVNADTVWLLSTNNYITLNTTALVFKQITGNQATETALGIAELATQDETDAGTDDLRIVTPLKLRYGFAISLAANGYIKFPTWMSGLIIQWGIGSSGGSSDGSVTYPLTFPTAVFMRIAKNTNSNIVTPIADPVEVTIYASGALSYFWWQGTNINTGVLDAPGEFSWIAIGY